MKKDEIGFIEELKNDLLTILKWEPECLHLEWADFIRNMQKRYAKHDPIFAKELDLLSDKWTSNYIYYCEQFAILTPKKQREKNIMMAKFAELCSLEPMPKTIFPTTQDHKIEDIVWELPEKNG